MWFAAKAWRCAAIGKARSAYCLVHVARRTVPAIEHFIRTAAEQGRLDELGPMLEAIPGLSASADGGNIDERLTRALPTSLSIMRHELVDFQLNGISEAFTFGNRPTF